MVIGISFLFLVPWSSIIVLGAALMALLLYYFPESTVSYVFDCLTVFFENNVESVDSNSSSSKITVSTNATNDMKSEFEQGAYISFIVICNFTRFLLTYEQG